MFNITRSTNTPFFSSIPKDLIKAKAVFNTQRFEELDQFRQQIKETKAGSIHQPYNHHKISTFWYRLIFLAFGFLFLGLGFLAISMSSAVSCGIFFNICHIHKGAMVSFSLILSFCSFLMALHLSAERDATLHAYRRGKRILFAIYKRKQIRLGINPLSFLGHKRHQALTLKHSYEEAIDRLSDKKDATLLLLHKISSTASLEKEEKENLFNQAIIEFQEKSIAISHAFRHGDF